MIWFLCSIVIMYEESTNGILIQVIPSFLEERSNPNLNFFLFNYIINITNQSPIGCKLLNRYWIIRNGDGREERISGSGVVGITPYLKPGESFQYESFCPLNRPYGNMRGEFEFITDENETLRAKIPLFFLRRD